MLDGRRGQDAVWIGVGTFFNIFTGANENVFVDGNCRLLMRLHGGQLE